MPNTNPDTNTSNNSNNQTTDNNSLTFSDLNLNEKILKNITSLGYEVPTPIQEQIIPLVTKGVDVIGQAQTGTGKTAAFALPLLSKVDIKSKQAQVLILAPTRELAIQVASACESYAYNIKGLNIMSIYGGQSYDVQLKKLKQGVQIVVGTPGRIMDHLRRGTLKLDGLISLVLDEADEMLRMGFIDDVEWILDKTPKTRQIALFSATMPQEIKRIANNYLTNPEHIAIKSRTSTASTINQYYWVLKSSQKMNALIRLLSFDFAQNSENNAIVFVRTKLATIDVVDFLTSKGFSCEALNGDVQQKNREKIIQKARQGKVQILVATDVAARGLDIENITHVINFDIPFDVETYIHRIGRTGRAGREGQAILFITPKEQRLLRVIENTTKQKLSKYETPSVEDVNNKRIENLLAEIHEYINNGVEKRYTEIVKENELFSEVDKDKIIAVLLSMYHDKQSFLIDEDISFQSSNEFESGNNRRDQSSSRRFRDKDNFRNKDNKRSSSRNSRPDRDSGKMEEGMQRYKIEVGKNHNVQPGNIVGAIANEIGLDSKHIGQIKIYENHSTVDLPDGMPKEVFQHLKKVRISGLPLNIDVDKNSSESNSRASSYKNSSKAKKK